MQRKIERNKLHAEKENWEMDANVTSKHERHKQKLSLLRHIIWWEDFHVLFHKKYWQREKAMQCVQGT